MNREAYAPRDAHSIGVRADAPETAYLCDTISTTLRDGRNADGGWAYRPGKRSRLEPTCWAILAFANGLEQLPDTRVLRTWTRSDGWLIDVPGTLPNHAFNAMAGLTLLQAPATSSLAEPTIRNLIASRGLRAAQAKEMRQDNSLRAWPWVEGTFSWLEPTAWCLLLLKQRRARGLIPRADERIRVGEAMLFDRACRNGGWNYGNSNVYGQDLRPYVPTTALALLALQDRRNEPSVIDGLRWLSEHASIERSALALSLSIICLRAYDLPIADQVHNLTNLIATPSSHTREGADLLGLATALYALRSAPIAAFRLPPG